MYRSKRRGAHRKKNASTLSRTKQHQIKSSRSPFSPCKWEDREREKEKADTKNNSKVSQERKANAKKNYGVNLIWQKQQQRHQNEKKRSGIKFTANGNGTREIVYQETRDIITNTRPGQSEIERAIENKQAASMEYRCCCSLMYSHCHCSLLLWPV